MYLPVDTYIVKVTDANGCNTTDTISLTSASPITATFTLNTVTCYGGNDGGATVIPSGGTAPYTYLWNTNGTPTDTITGLSAGNYIVTITDALGCISDATVYIPENNEIQHITTITDVSCNGGNDGEIQLTTSGGTAPFTYSWLPSYQLSSICTSLTAGTHTVIVTDINGCIDSTNFTVNEPDSLIANILILSDFNGFPISCVGSSDGVLQVNVSGGIPGPSGYSYLWSTGSTQQNVLNLLAGSYNVIVTDANGCTQTPSIMLNNPPAISFAFTPSLYNNTHISCFGYSDG